MTEALAGFTNTQEGPGPVSLLAVSHDGREIFGAVAARVTSLAEYARGGKKICGRGLPRFDREPFVRIAGGSHSTFGAGIQGVGKRVPPGALRGLGAYAPCSGTGKPLALGNSRAVSAINANGSAHRTAAVRHGCQPRVRVAVVLRFVWSVDHGRRMRRAVDERTVFSADAHSGELFPRTVGRN